MILVKHIKNTLRHGRTTFIWHCSRYDGGESSWLIRRGVFTIPPWTRF